MSLHYFKLVKPNAYLNTTANFEIPEIAQKYMDDFGSEFSVGHVSTLIHDVIDHINGQKYIGGIADEIMALTAYKTMHINSYPFFIEKVVTQLTMLELYSYDWGKLPADIEKQLKDTTLPKSKYKKIFKEYFPKVYDFDQFYQIVKSAVQDSYVEYEHETTILLIKNVQIVRKLIYLGMVKTLQKYTLDHPTNSAPARDALKNCLEHVSTNRYKIPNHAYLKIKVTKHTISISAKDLPIEAWDTLINQDYYLL